MLNIKDSIEASLTMFPAMPAKGQASVIVDGLAKAGYVIVPTEYIKELLVSSAVAAINEVTR